MENSESSGEPQIWVEQVSADWDGTLECWNIGWKVENAAADSIRLLAVRLPHGQFKSDELRFTPEIDLPAGSQGQFETDVRCNEPSGPVTENAFLIFQTIWHQEPWRLFVRVSVVVDEKGFPAAKVESVTSQRVGFSGVTN